MNQEEDEWMKAVGLNRYGGPQVLEPMDLATPEPAAGEMLIRVAAIGVNPADGKWRQGMFAAILPVAFPYVPGYDVAGFVEKGGDLPPGTRVMAMLDNLKGGAYAEFAVAAVNTVVVIPDDLDFVAAAALPCPGLTGVQLIDEDVRPLTGETIVITGATGAVGRFALHAAKRKGAIVVAAVREAHRQAALDLGADSAIPLDRADLAIESDHLVDTVGGSLIVPWALKVRPGGKFQTVSTDPIPTEDLSTMPAFSRVHADKACLAQIAKDVAAGLISSPQVRTMPLAQAAQAHDIMEKGACGGKIVLLTDAWG